MNQAGKKQFAEVIELMKPKTKKARNQRVKIALDVIAQVKAKKYIALHMRYLTILLDRVMLRKNTGAKDGYTDFGKSKASMQKVVKKAKVCEVCALGGLFASYVSLYNNVDSQLADSYTTTVEASRICDRDEDNNIVVVSPEVFISVARNPVLVELFGTLQLGLIECAFERNSHHLRGEEISREVGRDQAGYSHLYGMVIDDLVPLAVDFGRKHDTDTKRMLAIMRNIVKNEGVFLP